jgi:hypothetical protein
MFACVSTAQRAMIYFQMATRMQIRACHGFVCLWCVLCKLCVSDLKSDEVVGMEGDVTRGSELTRLRISGELALQASGPAYGGSVDENLEFKLIRLDFFFLLCLQYIL